MTKTKPANWLFFAQSDIELCKSAIEKEIYHLVCFHAQQAAEKLLKALLAYKNVSIPKIHSLIDLYELTRLLFPDLEQFKVVLRDLDTYYIPTRYPDALPGSLPEGLPTQKHAEEALEIANQIYEFVIKQIDKVPAK